MATIASHDASLTNSDIVNDCSGNFVIHPFSILPATIDREAQIDEDFGYVICMLFKCRAADGVESKRNWTPPILWFSCPGSHFFNPFRAGVQRPHRSLDFSHW
jgi:hypothetical protein